MYIPEDNSEHHTRCRENFKSHIAEIYLQHIEHTYIRNILHKHNISCYHRYVDDILIIYETIKTNITNTLNEFNNINKNLHFTIEHDSNNINFWT
jgi:hypothetical protein